MNAKGGKNEEKQEQDENTRIYKLFLAAKECNNMDMERSAVELLAENYKKMFALDNARSILLDLSKEYLHNAKLAEVTDNQFGAGCSEYVANAIKRYYGVIYEFPINLFPFTICNGYVTIYLQDI